MNLNLISIVEAIIFMLLTVIFALRYSNLLILARNEYEKAKNIISLIVLTFKKNQDTQSKKLERLFFQNENIQAYLEKLTIQFKGLENKFFQISKEDKVIPRSYKEVVNRLNLVRKEVEILTKNQQKLQKQLNFFEEKMQMIRKEEVIISSNENRQYTNLTETEQSVLRFLMNEGAKTAPEIEHKIGKTREHTSRLMKKLWQEGYIERDTHRIPYIYRINEKIKTMEFISR